MILSLEQKTSIQQRKRMIRLVTASMGWIVILTSGTTVGVAPGLADTSTTGVTIKCGKSLPLYSEKEGRETESDFFNNEANSIKQDAKKLAEENAINNVKADLRRQIAISSCPANCNKKTGAIASKITSPGNVPESAPGYIYSDYTAVAKAEGEVLVSCEPRKLVQPPKLSPPSRIPESPRSPRSPQLPK